MRPIDADRVTRVIRNYCKMMVDNGVRALDPVDVSKELCQLVLAIPPISKKEEQDG